jgi:ribosomal protein L37AE/L43A
MNNIVRLSEYRARRKRKEPATPDAGPHYYCERCESDQFKLYSSSLIHCAHCGVQIGNLSVGENGQGRQGTKT